jgi:serine-type D-Ala-D-Ala carboxypeptidase/endopeptidase
MSLHRKPAALLTLLALVFVVLRGPTSAVAEGVVERSRDERLVASHIQPLIDDGSYAGIVVGIVEPQGRRVFSYGSTSRAKDLKPSAESVFALASITKVFTGALLADLKLRGVVRLDDSIATFLPPGIIMPGSPMSRVTLLDLATHTSGLPRMATNAAAVGVASRQPPYSVRQMYDFLSHYQPRQRPGAQFLYSNIGIALLGHILERASGIPYERLLEQRILGPLDMSGTRISLNKSMRRRLAQGYNRGLKPVELKQFDVGKSSGGIYSTAADMMKYLEANLGISDASIVPALLEAQQPVRRVPGKENAFMGLAWHINKRGVRQIISKNGRLAGYQSFIAFSKADRTGIVALANSSPKGRKLDTAARSILFEILSQADRDSALREIDEEMAPPQEERGFW